jgi:23S rRNA (adenine2030-N6)-methyltransferase
MLSYRHAYHAGNHADVLKHLVLVAIGRHLGQKPAPFWIVDTHAGAGRYALDSEHAKKLGEWRDGIGRLWSIPDLPALAADYVGLVRMLNPDGQLRHYPGSPWLARQLLREGDRLRLFEMHSSDLRLLQECFAGAGRTVSIAGGDGFAGLKAILPPPPRRGLVLIDPSYETRTDYAAVPGALQDSLNRFATGTYAVWYPLLAKPEARRLPERLKGIGATRWLSVTLEVRAPTRDGFGMYGSGVFIVNPPWTLEKDLNETLPALAGLLTQGDGAGFSVTSRAA